MLFHLWLFPKKNLLTLVLSLLPSSFSSSYFSSLSVLCLLFQNRWCMLSFPINYKKILVIFIIFMCPMHLLLISLRSLIWRSHVASLFTIILFSVFYFSIFLIFSFIVHHSSLSRRSIFIPKQCSVILNIVYWTLRYWWFCMQ